MPNNIAVAVSADVTDLQVKCAVGKAEVSALTSEMNKLAKASAAGLIDPAGSARLQEVAGDLIKARAEAASLSAEFKEMTQATQGVGSTLEELHGKLSTAFEITGIGAAIEGVRSFGEMLESIGARATTIRTSSDVLGVTGEQFQAMEMAAEEAGVSVETLTRAAEKMNATLTEARDGSSAANEKLQVLGVTAEQIADPTFKVNELFEVLHDRLNTAATKQEEMNELTKEFGTRAGVVAEVLAKYDGSAEGVAEVMNAINGLTSEQTKKLQEAKAWWGELGTTATDTASKIFVAFTNMLPHATEGTDPTLRMMETDQAEAVEMSATMQRVNKEILQSGMESAKAGISAYKEGTQARVDQLQIYATAAAKYYGSDTVDVVVKANQEIIAAQRAVDDAAAESASRTTQIRLQASERVVQDKLQAANKEIAADSEYLDTYASQMKELVEFAERTDLEVTEKHSQLQRELAAINERIANDANKSAQQESSAWKGAVNEIEGAESSLVTNILSRRKGLTQSLEELSGQLVTKEIANDLRAVTTRLLLQTSAANSQKALEQGGLFYHLFASNQATTTTAVQQAQQTSATITAQAAQTSAVVAGNTARMASTDAAAASSLATSAAVGQKTVMQDAAKAFSGTYASVAQIPYVGWILAPIAASAAFAGVAAYEGLASLDTGTNYVPQDQLAQIHQGEAVIPKQYNPAANPFAMGGGGYSEEHNYNGAVHVNAFDAQSMARTLSRSSGRNAVVGGLVRAYRRGAR